MTKVEMWARRVLELFTFGRSKGWWNEKPSVPGLDRKAGPGSKGPV
jgi:hypothetical protein